MNFRAISLGIVVLWATPLVPQEPEFTAAPTEACLQEAVGKSERVVCIGVASSACLAAPGIGGSYAEAYCYQREGDYWDARLNTSYQALLASNRDENPALADALRDLQRAWIVFRDARCQAVFDAWGEGTGRSPAFVHCLMETTAEQVLFLEGGL